MSLTRPIYFLFVGLGAPALGWLFGLEISGCGIPLPAGAFVAIPAVLAFLAGALLKRRAIEIMLGALVAGVLGGLSLILTLMALASKVSEGAVEPVVSVVMLKATSFAAA